MRPVKLASLGTTLQNRANGPFNVKGFVGSGSAVSVVTNVDLIHNVGMVWLKDRTSVNNHVLVDTVRGVQKDLYTSSTSAEVTESSITAFNNNGFTLGTLGAVNTNGDNVAAWTFVEGYNFFRIVTYTGDGTSNRVINHSLGASPGMVVVKSRTATGNWATYHQNATGDLYLNTTAAETASHADIVSVSATSVTVGSGANVNASGVGYVMYIFGHDTSKYGHIQCGSYTGNGSNAGPSVSLGWQPQFVLVKKLTAATNWVMLDDFRGLAAAANNAILYTNTTAAETTAGYAQVNGDGFTLRSNNAEVNTNGSAYAYMAVRFPTYPLTVNTDMLDIITRTGNAASTSVPSTLSPDLVITKSRSNATDWGFTDRVRGPTIEVVSSSTAIEATFAADVTRLDNPTGITVGAALTGNANLLLATYVYYFLKRAPKFFDQLIYTGNGANTARIHNLQAPPELILIKCRGATARAWAVYCSLLGNTERLTLNTNAIPVTDATCWNSTTPTDTQFTVGTQNDVNNNGNTFVAYLFASLPGVSKVFSYTGNGTSQTINCGFSTGARLVLIKRTDVAGDWFVWDTARGITTGTDPHMIMDSNAAEITSDDSIAPSTVGFIISQVAATNVNVTGGTYIGFAIA